MVRVVAFFCDFIRNVVNGDNAVKKTIPTNIIIPRATYSSDIGLPPSLVLGDEPKILAIPGRPQSPSQLTKMVQPRIAATLLLLFGDLVFAAWSSPARATAMPRAARIQRPDGAGLARQGKHGWVVT